MKKLIIISFLLIGIFCFSQSVTEEYNSLQHRYEYFNADGDMIGYKSYDNLYNRWEYYEITSSKRQPRKYGDYIAPLGTSNLLNIESDLKQRGIEATDQAIIKQINYLRSYLDEHILDKCEHKKTSEYYRGFLTKEIDDLEIDGTKYQRDSILNMMRNSFHSFLNKAIKECAKKQ